MHREKMLFGGYVASRQNVTWKFPKLGRRGNDTEEGGIIAAMNYTTLAAAALALAAARDPGLLYEPAAA
jgi:hypothetical protein